MLTIKIDDSHLGKRIIKKALLTGKSTQDMVKDILWNALPETKKRLSYKHLNPEENGYIIHVEKEADNLTDEKKTLFSHVDDTAKYVENLRKNAWRNK